jgi:hypothetical protein
LNLTSVNNRVRIGKLIKKKRAAENINSEESFLTTPTSLSMKNSFLISSIGKTLDMNFKKKKRTYANAHRQRSSSRVAGTMFTKQIDSSAQSPTKRQIGKVQGFNPKPRDGHTGLMINSNEYVVFGGDRHHMPFNDLAGIDL